MNLQNAKILVTGGSLGIGKVAAKVFVDKGAQVGITGRDAATLEAAAKETGAFPITADVAKPDDVARTYEEFLGHFDGLDCLVNNGYRCDRPASVRVTPAAGLTGRHTFLGCPGHQHRP